MGEGVQVTLGPTLWQSFKAADKDAKDDEGVWSKTVIMIVTALHCRSTASPLLRRSSAVISMNMLVHLAAASSGDADVSS